MATLNRFPLFGLWNRVAADLLGYEEDEAKCIGHGVAVLYAIRAQGAGHKKPPAGDSPAAMATDDLGFGGDSLPCEFDADGRVLKCRVGCQTPKDADQTPASYDAAIEAKIDPAYLERLRAAMRKVLATYDRRELQGSLIYQVYDDWKLACKAGRRVDLEKLIAWLETKAQARPAAA